MRTTVLKGAVVPDDATVASGAVVSGVFTEPGTVLAGCPAKVVRRDTVWSSEASSGPPTPLMQ